mmetsp:Transcript_39429/g.82443  ORF Transcript_39429/g.82443 Transcript_39429/m.82443 type:complete len:467 (-) Transcript_39429:132-1532(-)
MGGGLAFLTKKSFNPANWSNQRQVWEARQNHETEKRRIAERESQLKREREEEDLARVVGGEVDGGRKALGFMYDAGKVPGLDRRNNNGDNDNGEGSICFGKSSGDDEDKQERGGGDNTASLFERQPGDDDAAAAFRAMLAMPVEEPNIAGSAATAPLPEGDDGNDNVDGASNDGAADDDKNESRERDHRTNLEKAVGRGINAQSGVTLAQQFERFPMLKGAPMVLQKPGGGGAGGGSGKKEEKSAVNVTGLNFKPLGQVLRNVQCLACGKWGHARGDRECEVSGWNPFASASAVATPVPTAVVKNALEIVPPMLAESALAEKVVVAEPKLKDRVKDRKDEKRRSRRKEDRHRKKKRKHKRRRRERSPSYSSSDSASSYSSYDGDDGYESRKKSRGHHRRRCEDSDDSGGQCERPQRCRKEHGGGSNHHRSDRRSSRSRRRRISSSSRRHGRDRRDRSRSRSPPLSE